MSKATYITKEELNAAVGKLERKIKANAPDAVPKQPRELTEYNKFMKTQMAKFKKSHPDSKDAFKKCADEWNKQKKKSG